MFTLRSTLRTPPRPQDIFGFHHNDIPGLFIPLIPDQAFKYFNSELKKNNFLFVLSYYSGKWKLAMTGSLEVGWWLEAFVLL